MDKSQLIHEDICTCCGEKEWEPFDEILKREFPLEYRTNQGYTKEFLNRNAQVYGEYLKIAIKECLNCDECSICLECLKKIVKIMEGKNV